MITAQFPFMVDLQMVMDKLIVIMVIRNKNNFLQRTDFLNLFHL